MLPAVLLASLLAGQAPAAGLDVDDDGAQTEEAEDAEEGWESGVEPVRDDDERRRRTGDAPPPRSLLPVVGGGGQARKQAGRDPTERLRGDGLDLSARLESQGGLIRRDNGQSDPAADLTFSPNLYAQKRLPYGGGRARLNLSPRATVRGSPTSQSAFANVNGFASLEGGREENGLRWQLLGSGTFGQVDFDEAGERLGQPFGLGGAGGIVPLGSATVTGELAHRPFSTLRLYSLLVGDLLLTPSEPIPGAWEIPKLPPGFEEAFGKPGGEEALVPLFQASAEVGTQWLATRRDLLGARTRLGTVHTLLGPIYAGVEASGLYTRRVLKRLDIYGEAGALLALDRNPGPAPLAGAGALWPLAGLGMELNLPQSSTAGFSVAAAARLEPYYDAFLGALTERAAARTTVVWTFGRTLEISGGVDAYTLVGVLEDAEGAGTHVRIGDAGTLWARALLQDLAIAKDTARYGDDHILGANAQIAWFPWPYFAVTAGGSASARIRNARLGEPAQATPQAVLFVAVQGGYPLIPLGG